MMQCLEMMQPTQLLDPLTFFSAAVQAFCPLDIDYILKVPFDEAQVLALSGLWRISQAAANKATERRSLSSCGQ